jgi:DNA-binding beta-propeller fold protein YncE
MNVRNVWSYWIAVLAALGALASRASAHELPNGWSVTPAGAITPLGTLPLHMTLDRSGRWLAVTNAGYARQFVTIVDVRSGRVADSATLDGTFYGVAFSPDGRTLYASTAAKSGVRRFSFDPSTGRLGDRGTFRLSERNLWIAGIAVSPDGKTVYAAGNLTNEVYALDARNGGVLWEADAGVGPYAVALSPDGRRAYVSDWTGGTITGIATADGHRLASVPVDAHPNALLFSRDGATLYVACANSNTVVVMDARNFRRLRTIDASLWPGALEGSTPNGLALSRDGGTLFVADADDDAVVVVDLRSPERGVIGAIPVGWYVTDVATSRDGRTLFALDGKGTSGHANPKFGRQGSHDEAHYVASLATGDLERVSIPTQAALASGLKKARENSPYRSTRGATPQNPSEPSIKHVIYVIKENRTYDQVLGDDKRGNGDASLAMFGRRVTPNTHRLADDFALLDNLDTDSEVSADGHNWATAAYATDYVQKLWPSNYSGRGRDYDFQGGKAANPPAGYLWDDALAHGHTARDYGEDIDSGASPFVPEVRTLAGHFDPRYSGWGLKHSDQGRIDEWLREFKSFERSGNLPDLEIVYLPDDHTAATTPGFRTPDAYVASNDYAVGRLVDALSKSRYWNDTVVFVVEDDAQNGPDHVSDQRTVALVVGGLVRRGAIDHTHYTQCSILRTIELLLGLPPMSQFDAGATPMTGLFARRTDLRPWTASKPQVDLRAVNAANAPGARASLRLNLDRPDAVDAAAFNRILLEYAAAGHQ